MKKSPRCQAGKKKSGGKSKQSTKSELMLHSLYEIGIPDKDQPSARLGLLQDQRTERKSVLPPIIGTLAVESRRKE